jgi:hypothetical protein
LSPPLPVCHSKKTLRQDFVDNVRHMIKRFSPLKPQDIFQFSLPTLLELFENQIFFPSIIIIYCAKGIDKSILWELLSEIMHETTKTKFDFILMTRTEIICTKYLKKKNVTHHHLVTIQKVFKPFAKASSQNHLSSSLDSFYHSKDPIPLLSPLVLPSLLHSAYVQEEKSHKYLTQR